MAVPRRIRDKNIQRLNFVEEKADSFDAKVEDIENTVFSRVLSIINSLDVKDGKVKQTAANLKRALKASAMRKNIVTDRYKQSVNNYIKGYDEVREKNNEYFKLL